MQIQTSVGPTGNINNQLQLAISFAYCLNIEKKQEKNTMQTRHCWDVKNA